MPTAIWLVTTSEGTPVLAFSNSADAVAESNRLERVWQGRTYHVSSVTVGRPK